MTKQLPSKKQMIIICAAVIAVVAAVTAFIALRTSGEESYRSIMVYELEGSAVIERADIGTIDAAENLYLESGDRVQVREGSMMRLKLDNDKYITAEENTVFVLTAKGNEQDSETKINLEQGAIINEIQNPLSEKSTYETITPNSVMAVRGTIYRAELCRDEDGNLVTKLYCFEGVVDMCAVSENDMSAPVTVEAGNEAGVNSADLKVSEVIPIDYMSFSPQTLKILNMMNIDTSAATDTSAGAEDNAASPVGRQDNISGQNKTDEKDITEDVDKTENTNKAENSNKTENTNKTDRKDNSAVQKSGDGEVSISDSRDKADEPVQTTAGISQSDPDSGSEAVGNAGSGSGDNQPDKEPEVKPDNPEPPKPPKPAEYTVTFQYNGGTFATQKVKAGEKAEEPVLKPAQNGGWYFDFNKAINENTTITWQQ